MGNHSPLESHRNVAALEDARFILSNGGSLAEAARRVGLIPDTLEKYLTAEEASRRDA